MPFGVQAHGDHTSGSAQADPDSSSNDTKHVVAQGNIGLGFGMAVLAAGCSALGALLPLYDDLPPKWKIFTRNRPDFQIASSPNFLAGSMSFSAGVLIFLSLCDLIPESSESFASAHVFNAKHSDMVTTCIFIAVVMIMHLITTFGPTLHRRWRQGRWQQQQQAQPSAETLDSQTPPPQCQCAHTHSNSNEHTDKASLRSGRTSKSVEAVEAPHIPAALQAHAHNPHVAKLIPRALILLEARRHDAQCPCHEYYTDISRREWRALAWQITVALAIHNFPEALSTFAAAIRSTSMGALYGIALALHKIPEGLMVSLPIYYVTGSRWMALLIAASINTVAQLLGATLGYALFVTYWNPAINGTLFAVAGAMLFYTVVHSVIPQTRKYDPVDRYCTLMTFVGFCFFMLVNALFAYAPTASSDSD
ncbi:hypothetical protein EV182_002664 [Spiromyces aspiralis]|uniref:Uncharacterized protein n=1 Tax=Spiromyces aspiralis TaxID=68401 RepID=A0ACC1HRS1_9FUNG|nr:hypothetical protein EV182_002664 [Spiromyces aspiralis]